MVTRRATAAYRSVMATCSRTSKAQGFVVARHPYEDPAHKHTPAPQAKRLLHHIRGDVLRSFDLLPKPVVITCSAGQDRSAPVAAYLYARRHGSAGDLGKLI